jgi:hypothetical protein
MEKRKTQLKALETEEVGKFLRRDSKQTTTKDTELSKEEIM